MRALSAVVALALLPVAGRARADESPAPPAAPPDDLGAVHAELARDAEQIQALRADLDAEKQARQRPALRFSGFLQVDWIAHDQASANEINDSNGTLLNQDRFTLRRGHMRVDAERGLLSGALEIDVNTTSGPQVRPIDAEVSVRWPERPDERLPSLLATAGLMRIPFGFEVQELDYVRPFLERATALQALFPGEYDLGVRLKAKYRFIDWALAVMNGDPIGSKVFPDVDPVHQKDLVGRIGVDVEIVPGVRF